jgi:putative heme-binding domain-containing protein
MNCLASLARCQLRSESRLVLILSVLCVALCSAAGQTIALEKKEIPVREYRQYGMTRDGDVARGRSLFSDEQRVACFKCHSVDGSASKAGPDLLSVGDKFSRRELIDAVLLPSETIAVGYSTTYVETKAGDEYQGVLKQATERTIELMCGDGQRAFIATQDVKEQRGSALSLMPEGLQAGLSRQEFTDLIEYLASLKETNNVLTSDRGMPNMIPQLAQPVQLRPLLKESLCVPTNNGPKLGLTWFGQVPGRMNRFLAAHQAGLIWLIEKEKRNDTTVTTFADFTAGVFSARGPNGLLGIAFHPQFRKNRKYYVKHQVFEEGKIVTLLVEREAAPDGRKDSGKPPRVLLKIPAVAEHHNGGCIEFGPDGFLYFGMGDSAPNFDPQGHGQDLGLLFGKMLRIDVNGGAADLGYRVPPDNPFAGRSDARGEIWAYGLREPWRFSFDAATGDLWVADLGQERGDEVNIVRRGENHGWNVYEGFALFSNQHRKQGAAYVAPMFSTRRKDGTSIVGGRVYRGDKKSSFYGVYIFGDHQSKRIWGLTHQDRELKKVCHIATSPQPITSFAADEAGTMYVVGYEGMVYRLDFAGANWIR